MRYNFKDISDGTELVKIALTGVEEQSAAQRLEQRGFKEYIPTSQLHPSFWSDHDDHDLTSGDVEYEEASGDEGESTDTFSSDGCSCTKDGPVALESGSRALDVGNTAQRKLCVPESGCECVAQYGNFYKTQHSEPTSSTVRLELHALPPSHAILECNPACACQRYNVPASAKRRKVSSTTSLTTERIIPVGAVSDCGNRVVGQGILAALAVQPTTERAPQSCGNDSPRHSASSSEAGCYSAKGFGLFAVKSIPRGTFICEYAGELIGSSEARRRWANQRQAKEDESSTAKALGDNYIFSIQERNYRSVYMVNIDATEKGNVARFINHCCPPSTNVVVLPVRTDAPLEVPSSLTSSRLRRIAAPPRAAMFAKRDIEAGEELGYDYADAGGMGLAADKLEFSATTGLTKCHCGSSGCRGWMPFDVSL